MRPSVVKNTSTFLQPDVEQNESTSSMSSKSLTFEDIISTDDLLNYFLFFKDPTLKNEYFELSNITSASNTSIYYFSIIQFLFLSCWIITCNLFNYSGYEAIIPFFIVNVILIVIAIALSFLLCLNQKEHANRQKKDHMLGNNQNSSSKNNNNPDNDDDSNTNSNEDEMSNKPSYISTVIINILSTFHVDKYLLYYEIVFSFIMCLTPGLSLVAKVYAGSCYNDSTSFIIDDNNIFKTCNPMQICDILPQPIFILNFICPYIVKVVLNSVNGYSMILNWLTSFLTTLGAIVILQNDKNQYGYSARVLIFYSISALLLYENEHTNRSMFLLWRKNKNDYKINIEREHQQNISINLSEELRNIISNTAHDMKSPCTGVLLGLESLETSIKKTTLENYTTNQKPHLELIRYMHSTIAFMMMSINRSMDFTKIQGKLLLKPTPESIEIMVRKRILVQS